MKYKKLIIISSLIISTVGCSKDYSPEANATGEQTFQAACVECHKKDAQGNLFSFNKTDANAAYISERIKNGNMMMPKFPNIQGAALDKLNQYILQNSTTK